MSTTFNNNSRFFLCVLQRLQDPTRCPRVFINTATCRNMIMVLLVRFRRMVIQMRIRRRESFRFTQLHKIKGLNIPINNLTGVVEKVAFTSPILCTGRTIKARHMDNNRVSGSVLRAIFMANGLMPGSRMSLRIGCLSNNVINSFRGAFRIKGKGTRANFRRAYKASFLANYRGQDHLTVRSARDALQDGGHHPYLVNFARFIDGVMLQSLLQNGRVRRALHLLVPSGGLRNATGVIRYCPQRKLNTKASDNDRLHDLRQTWRLLRHSPIKERRSAGTNGSRPYEFKATFHLFLPHVTGIERRTFPANANMFIHLRFKEMVACNKDQGRRFQFHLSNVRHASSTINSSSATVRGLLFVFQYPALISEYTYRVGSCVTVHRHLGRRSKRAFTGRQPSREGRPVSTLFDRVTKGVFACVSNDSNRYCVRLSSVMYFWLC